MDITIPEMHSMDMDGITVTVLSLDVRFPTMLHFDMNKLRRACATSRLNLETPNDVRSEA